MIVGLCYLIALDYGDIGVLFLLLIVMLFLLGFSVQWLVEDYHRWMRHVAKLQRDRNR